MPPPRRSATSRVLVAGLAAAAVLVGTAGPGPDRAAAAPARAAVAVTRLDGTVETGALVKVDAAGAWLEGAETPLPLDEPRELAFPGATAAPPADAPGPRLALQLRGGEDLRGRLLAADESGLTLAAPDGGRLKVVFDVVRRVEPAGPAEAPCADVGRTAPPRPGHDVAWLRTDDVLVGTLEGATLEGVALDVGGARRVVGWDALKVLHVDEPELPPDGGLVLEADLVDGSRLPCREVACDGTAWRLTTRAGLVVTAPVGAVRVLRGSGGRFVHGSQLPFTAEHTPYYADDTAPPAWYAATADRRPDGCPLVVGGVVHRRGIGVHAKSVVRLPLDGRFVRCFASFGIDDAALAGEGDLHGDVTARVLADDRELWSSQGSVKGGEPPRPVGPLDVRGVKVLVLEVGFGGARHWNDRADWLDLVLEKAK